MEVKEWIGQHRKGVSLGVGGALMVAAIAMMFWQNGEGSGNREGKAEVTSSATAARGTGSGRASAPSGGGESAIMKAYREKQAQHLRYLLIAMIAAGAGFLIYGWMKRKEK